MQPSLRVQLRSETTKDERGNPVLVHRQELQKRRWWGWHTVDVETIPEGVSIVGGCINESQGWTSRFSQHGNFGRDGYITPLQRKVGKGQRPVVGFREAGATARRLALAAILVSLVIIGLLATTHFLRGSPSAEPETAAVTETPHEPGRGSHIR